MDTCSSFAASVLSRSCINTNKCMRCSILVRAGRENVIQNTEEEPQISPTSSGRPGPQQHEKEKKGGEVWGADFSKYQSLLAFHAVGPIP